MNLSDIALRRPVGSIVLSILIVLFGAVGYTFLGVREYPAIDPPTINVRTNYTGANAEIIESQITEPLEKAINGIEGIKSVSSSSALGNSNITVEFDLGADLEKAANDVRDKVSQAQRNLPQDIDAPPSVSKSDANNDPIIFMPIQSTRMNELELSDYVENVMQEKLQTIPGVSEVRIFGQRRRAMRLWMDPMKLAARNLTAQDVYNALENENVELPGGKITGDKTELTVKTFGRLVTEEDFNNLIIREDSGGTVRFRHVGEAVLGPENPESVSRLRNANAVSLAIIPQPGANYIAIADEFYKRFEQIKETMPEGLIVSVGMDKSKFVRKSIREVRETLLIAISLVIFIIYLFFRDWLIALRPLIDIPVSLIGAFFIMYMFDFSINVLTLLGIVLATGLVVDDGIVVTENIYKKIEQGMDRMTAAREGTREIFFAVISTSVTLAVVFIPVIFLQGFTGRLFREFGIVVAGAVLISALVSLTLTPVLNVKMSRKVQKHSRFYLATEPFFRRMENFYKRTLEGFMRRRWVALIMLGACIALIFISLGALKSELAPLEDRSVIRLPMSAPEGTSFDYMDDIVFRFSQIAIDSVPEARMVFSLTAAGGGNTSVNSGMMFVRFDDPETRKASQQQIADRLSRIAKRFPEAKIFPAQEQTISTSLSSGSQQPVQFVIQNLDFSKIRAALPKFLEEAQKDPAFSNVDANLKFNRPEVEISIDRLKAAQLGVNARDLSSTFQLMLSGRRFGYFQLNGKQYQVIGQVDREFRDDTDDLLFLYVRSRTGKMVPMKNLIEKHDTATPPTLYHYNRYKSATISASLAPGKTLGEGIEVMQRIAKEQLDETFEVDYAGPSRDFMESSSNTSFALIIALALIYLILAAQFESFRDPVVIMLTVPLAFAGALGTLWIFDQTINIFSQIGMIMLIGLVTKNGILIVEFSNQLRKKNGMSRIESVKEAAVARLRPILMTTLATVLGALPIALALGAGAKSRMSLGIVIVGGLLFSLLLTLYVIPAMYSYFSARDKKETTSPESSEA